MSDVDVYLDVDGVLNAVATSDPDWGWGQGETADVNGWPIRWAPELVARLNALAARPNVHFHWLTTWLHDAPKLLAEQIGLDGADWPVLGEHEWADPTLRDSWWKLPAAQAAAESGHRVVWIDDDLIDTAALDWAKALGDRIMLVQPDPRVGITEPMMAMVEDWTKP